MDTTVAVVGPGAIGATFAAVARRAGVRELTLCGRTPVERITVRADDGDAVVLDGDGGAVRTDPGTVHGPVDWLLLAVKAHQTEGAGHWLRALAGPGTVVVVLQNGVEQRELVAPHVDGATVLPAVVWCPAEPLGRDTVRLRGVAALTVPDRPESHRLAELLAPGGARVDRAADFRTVLWRKLTMNAVAGLTVLAGRRAGMFRRPDVHRLAVALARECVTVAAAEGARLTEADADAIVDELAAMPADLGSSILFDRVAGRTLEWDARNGVVRRFGARHRIPTPVSDVLVPLLAAASDDPN
jgi:2-dehydropantoate 2-reductase